MKNKIIYALGYFDGVHLGHQALLKACRQAAQSDILSGAVTFLGHPEKLLTGNPPKMINTYTDRRNLLLQYVEKVLELQFTEDLKNMSWQDFCQLLITQHGAVGFVCGSDFRFGKGGTGNAENLARFCREQGLFCQVVPQQEKDGLRISSTYIRTLLEQGNMEKAAEFLGHPHILSGTVISGKQIGRTIGIPTANVAYPEELLHLPRGVYACQVTVDGNTYASVTNVGCRPTVDGQSLNIENWLQDFSGDLYGKNIQIFFYDYLRPEQKFPNLDALQEQIQKDKRFVQKYTKFL